MVSSLKVRERGKYPAGEEAGRMDEIDTVNPVVRPHDKRNHLPTQTPK